MAIGMYSLSQRMRDYKAKFVKVCDGNRVVLRFDLGFDQFLGKEVHLFPKETGPKSLDAKLFLEIWFATHEDVYATVHKWTDGSYIATIYPYLHGVSGILGTALQDEMLEADLA